MADPERDADARVLPPSETPPNLPEGYSFIRHLGGGGFGQVVVARIDRTGLPVAIKLADPERHGAIAALERERRALTSVSERGIPRVIDHGSLCDGVQWLAMSILPGIAWPGPTPLDVHVLLHRAGTLLSRLSVVHGAGFMHGDLKPANILVARDGDVSIVDFGLTMEVPASSPESQPVIGTVEYMSPEQCTPGATLDERSDLYAVGVLLFRALGGSAPFSGSAEEIREGHRSRRPGSLLTRGVPPPLADLVMSALAKDPNERPTSALSFRAELEAIGRGELSYALPSSTLEPAVESSSPVARETQKVALLWFTSQGALVGLQQVVRESGGHLVLARGRAYAAVYTLSECENPVRSAAAAGTVLLGRGLASRVLLDVVETTLQRRPNGQPRIAARVLRGDDQHLPEDDPPGLFATAAAAHHVPDVEQSAHPTRHACVRLGRNIDPLDVTHLSASVLPLFGRHAELGALLEQSSRPLEGPTPGLTTVTGERGIGKTRLARELVEHLMVRSTDSRVIALKAPEPSSGSRESTLRRLLRSIVPLPNDAPEDPRGLLRAKLGVDVSNDVALGLQWAMGWLSGSDPAVVRLKAAPGALRSVVGRSIGEALLIRARSRPLWVIIDDAQFLDDAALDAIEYATRSAAHAPIWICVFARPSLCSSRAAWGAQAAHHEKMELPPLSVDDAGALVRSLLDQATNVSESVVTRLVSRTKGLPLVIVELIRTLKRDGFVRRGERGSGWVVDSGALRHSPDVPLVQWLIDRELDALSTALRAHAGLMAVLGASFTIERASALVRQLELAGQAPPSELDPAVGVHRLRRAGVLVETAPHRYEFRNDLLREAAYQKLPADVRQATHLAAYRLFELDAQLAEHDRIPQLAFHATGAGLHEQAVDLELQLARRAVDRHDYLLAHEAFHRALEKLESDDPRRLEAIHGLGLMRFRLGQHQDAIRDLQRATTWAEELQRPLEEAEILLDLATVLDWAEDYPTSSELVERASRIRQESPSALLQARLRLGQGRSLFRRGDGPHATEKLREAAEIAQQVGEDAYETRVIALLLAAPLAALGGDEPEGRRMFEQLLELCRTHGDQLHLSTTYLNRCVVWLAGVQVEPLQADLRQAIEIARTAGYPLIEMRALFNLGEIAYMLGKHEDALRDTRASIELVLQISGASQRVVVSRLLLARCHLAAENFAEARRELQWIGHLQAQRRREGASDLEYMPSDHALFRMVELSLDPATPEQWDALIEDAAEASMQQELVEVLEFAGVAAERAGMPARARELYDRALAEAEAHPTLLKQRVATRRRRLVGA